METNEALNETVAADEHLGTLLAVLTQVVKLHVTHDLPHTEQMVALALGAVVQHMLASSYTLDSVYQSGHDVVDTWERLVDAWYDAQPAPAAPADGQ